MNIIIIIIIIIIMIWFDKGYAINNAYYSPSKIDLEKERKKGYNFFQDVRGCIMQVGCS
jgi:hypothetical protein